MLKIDRDWAASIVGGLAVTFRQTNIIWVAFVAAQAAYPLLLQGAFTCDVCQIFVPFDPLPLTYSANLMQIPFLACTHCRLHIWMDPQCVHERMLEGKEDPARFSFSLTTLGQVREVAWGLLLLLREPMRLLELVKVSRWSSLLLACHFAYVNPTKVFHPHMHNYIVH